MNTHPPARHFFAGLRAIALWSVNPVSAEGSARGWQMVCALGGPDVYRALEALEAHPTGRRLLRERPDLGAALRDTDALARMPEGSVGHRFREFVSRPGVIPSYIVAGAVYADGALDRLDWSDDAKWLLERMAHVHDLFHVLAGYGPDLAGEALLIAFTAGVADPMGRGRPFVELYALSSAALLAPTVGAARWRAAMQAAFERGLAVRRHRAFWTHPLEELLPRPLEEVRAELGIPPVPGVFVPTSTWIEGWFADRYAKGFGAMERWARVARRTEQLVDAGVPMRTLLAAPARQQARAFRLLQSGAERSALVASLVGAGATST